MAAAPYSPRVPAGKKPSIAMLCPGGGRWRGRPCRLRAPRGQDEERDEASRNAPVPSIAYQAMAGAIIQAPDVGVVVQLFLDFGRRNVQSPGLVDHHAFTMVVPRGELAGEIFPLAPLTAGRPFLSAAGVVEQGIFNRPDRTASSKESSPPTAFRGVQAKPVPTRMSRPLGVGGLVTGVSIASWKAANRP